MDQTTVLSPFEKGTKESPLTPTQLKQLAKHKADFKRIEEALNGWSEQPQNYKIDSMADFLKYLKMSYQDYISAIRTSIHTDTVFCLDEISFRRDYKSCQVDVVCLWLFVCSMSSPNYRNFAMGLRL